MYLWIPRFHEFFEITLILCQLSLSQILPTFSDTSLGDHMLAMIFVYLQYHKEQIPLYKTYTTATKLMLAGTMELIFSFKLLVYLFERQRNTDRK